MADSKDNTPRRGVLSQIKGFRYATASDLKEDLSYVRDRVIPKIKRQMKQKEKGAERARTFKVF